MIDEKVEKEIDIQKKCISRLPEVTDEKQRQILHVMLLERLVEEQDKLIKILKSDEKD